MWHSAVFNPITNRLSSVHEEKSFANVTEHVTVSNLITDQLTSIYQEKSLVNVTVHAKRLMKQNEVSLFES